ncbi:MAG: betaine-aldehyde dehydrogenase [Chromatiales bacterium]|jgi:phenylacetaldehyde dehydrogenase|nr:betaine-aldehyde dehydrogenase [Chromatiales bacterium]MDP6150379.1 aldehyde dehydrogenase family protein [Gammaproteobacteria bacterium]MDP7270034.1 aldehyde dehydrogenase family protein [Gammaproteobacteria bacterium]HJP04689.1 aldehyde dehydrogenase family protein [Gammaproteobacteria bacterium]
MSAVAEAVAIAPETSEFLARDHKLFINGQWVDAHSREKHAVYDPATEAQIATFDIADETDVDMAVAAARKAFKGEWSKISSHERSIMMMRLADEIDANLQTLAEIEVMDNGLPMALAKYTISGHAANFVRYYAGWPTKILGDTIPVSPMGVPNGESLTYTKREPIGVVGAIIPWNAPIAMFVLKLAPALAAGCTMVIKPAELTPLIALKLCDLIKKAGIPDGVVNVIPGAGRVAGAAMATHPDIDKISFTGSTEVGQRIVQSCLGNLKKVTLELGGKSPVVVFPDADIEAVKVGAIRAAFFLQGQNCMAGTRLFVHQDVFDEVIQGVAAIANAMKIGPGLDPNNDLGPLISADQREVVMSYIQAGKDEGAELICGGEALPGKGHFVQPTIFTHPHQDIKIAREEIFGPVLFAQPFSDSDLEAIAAEANKSIYGLSGSVWTKDISVGLKMASLIDSGQVSINCHAAVDPAIPFGGNKMSGWGREFGKEGLEPYLKTKSTTVIF